MEFQNATRYTTFGACGEGQGCGLLCDPTACFLSQRAMYIPVTVLTAFMINPQGATKQGSLESMEPLVGGAARFWTRQPSDMFPAGLDNLLLLSACVGLKTRTREVR